MFFSFFKRRCFNGFCLSSPGLLRVLYRKWRISCYPPSIITPASFPFAVKKWSRSKFICFTLRPCRSVVDGSHARKWYCTDQWGSRMAFLSSSSAVHWRYRKMIGRNHEWFRAFNIGKLNNINGRQITTKQSLTVAQSFCSLVYCTARKRSTLLELSEPIYTVSGFTCANWHIIGLLFSQEIIMLIASDRFITSAQEFMWQLVFVC